MATVVGKAYQRWNRERTSFGWKHSVQWIANRAGQRAVRLHVDEMIWLHYQNCRMPGEPPAEFDYRFLTAEELARFTSPEFELDDSHVAQLAAGHDLCFAAMDGDRLASYGWYALGSVEAKHNNGVPMSYPAHVSYMYKGYTHPDYRGLRLHGFCIKLGMQQAAEQWGVTDLVSTVNWTNIPSLRSCERLGCEFLGREISILHGKLLHAPRLAKERGVRFGQEADLSNRKGKGQKAKGKS